MTWRDRAACRNADQAIFYPSGKGVGRGSEVDYRPALTICGKCPVREACLAEALLMERTNGGRHGVWGMTTPDQRAQMAKVRR